MSAPTETHLARERERACNRAQRTLRAVASDLNEMASSLGADGHAEDAIAAFAQASARVVTVLGLLAREQGCVQGVELLREIED